MSDQDKTFTARKPRNRDEALAYIEKLCKFYDIELEEDTLLQVINAQAEKHEQQLNTMWLQVVGATLEATGKEFLTIDRAELLGRQPYNVKASEHGAKTRFRLAK